MSALQIRYITLDGVLEISAECLTKWVSAIKYCKEGLKIQQSVLGNSNSITMTTLLICAGNRCDFEQAIKWFRSSFEQENRMLLREICINKGREETDKGILMITEATAHIRNTGTWCSREWHILSLNTRKQQAEEQDLINLADNVMHYGSVLWILSMLSCLKLHLSSQVHLNMLGSPGDSWDFVLYRVCASKTELSIF